MQIRTLLPQAENWEYERQRYPFLARLGGSLAGLIQSEWEWQATSYQGQKATGNFD